MPRRDLVHAPIRRLACKPPSTSAEIALVHADRARNVAEQLFELRVVSGAHREARLVERRGRLARDSRPRSVIAASVMRRSRSWAARETSPSRSRPSIVFVTLVGWTCSREPILPSGSEPARL